jgi:hypothetical protein
MHAKFEAARKVHRGRNLWWAKYARGMIDAHDTDRLLTGFCPEDAAELKRALRPRQAASQFLRRPRQGFQDLHNIMSFFRVSWDDLCSVVSSLHASQFTSGPPLLASWERFPLYDFYGRDFGAWVQYLRVVNSVGLPPLRLLQGMHARFGTSFFREVHTPYMACFLASVDPSCGLSEPRSAQWSWVCEAVFASPFSGDHWDGRDEWLNVAFDACPEEDRLPFARCLATVAHRHGEDILDGWDLRPALARALSPHPLPPADS